MRIWTIAGEAQGWMWFSRCALKAMDAPFDVGYQFTIEINLPNDKGQINGKCEVIWVNEIEAENYPKGMGVQLVELEPKNRELLEEYLKELENA
jgi:Tfp pilus assembly protein PilZ